MNKKFIKVGTWLWAYLPGQSARQFAWSMFLWWVRGKKVRAAIDGLAFDLDLSELIDAGIFVNRFEKEVSHIIEVMCKEGFVVLDIGANIGAHTLRFAQNVGVDGCVHAFEPTDCAFKKLRKNIDLNNFKNIRTYKVALSNQNLSDQKISYRSSWKTDGSLLQESSVVDFIRLDDWAESEQISRVDLIKIDVDGNEVFVIDGGRNLIDRHKPLFIMEIGPYHFEKESSNPWIFLSDIGYKFWNAKTKYKYKDLAEIERSFLSENKGVDSINVLASPVEGPELWWPRIK